ncbi:8254_t:CDS:2 [Entrophospora sp. SA101]|nr:6474_t:CDS:2 [Entrophospora sp. SA101]CAJ0755447.1 8254_t:CDS:2 [Entrophospora sp. SA101]
MNDKKNLTKDELANYLKNLKNKAPPKRSSLITPPKSPITSTVPSNNNNNINNRKVGGLYGPRVYPSPNKTTSILTRSLSQKIEENIKTPSSPESVSSSAAYSPPSSTQLNTTDSALSESSFRAISANASNTKIDDGTKGSYVLSAAFKSHTASSKPASRTPGGNNESYWNAQFDDAQKKFPHSEKSDEKNISNSNNTINNNNGIAINNNKNNQEHKRNSTPTSKIHPSNNQPLGDNNNNSRLSSSIHNIASLNCGGCGKSITGKVLSAMGKKWHPDHFTCTKCNTSLEHVAFFEQDGLPYCHLDFHELFSPRCGYCNTPIEGQSITALGKSWHVGHFFCRECGGPFESGGFMVHDGFPYCEKDWMKKFAPKCKGCQNPIKGEFTNALDGKWHRDCFGCKTCKQPFNSSYYYIHQGQPYCDVHYREMLS